MDMLYLGLVGLFVLLMTGVIVGVERLRTLS